MLVIDTHVHLGIDYWLLSHNRNDVVGRSSYQDVVSLSPFLKQKGISLAGIAAIPWPSGAPDRNGVVTYAKENEWLINELSTKPAITFIGVNPHSELSIKNAEKAAQSNPSMVKGVKVHPILTETSLSWLATQQSFLAMLRDLQLVMLIHVCSGREHLIGRVSSAIDATPKDCLRLAERFPDNRFIFDHCMRLSDWCLIKIHDYPNVYVDTAALSCHQNWSENGDSNIFPSSDSNLQELAPVQVWEYLVNDLQLSDRLLYGSDYPYTLWWGESYWDEFKPFWEANISPEARHKIAFENARTMLFHDINISAQDKV